MTEFEKHEEKIAAAKRLPLCEVCSKQSDGSKDIGQGANPVHFCGTCYDLWLDSGEARRVANCGKVGRALDAVFYCAVGDFVRRVKAERLWARRSK